MTKEKEIGKITHYYGKIGVAVVELQKSSLAVGDTIHVKGGQADFEQNVMSIQVDHKDVKKAKKKSSIGLKIDQAVRAGAILYKVK